MKNCVASIWIFPREVNGVETTLLNPRKNWKNQAAHDENARLLIEKFVENFKRFNVSDAIRKCGTYTRLILYACSSFFFI